MKKIAVILMLFAVALPATGCKSGKNPELQAQVEKYEEKADKAGKTEKKSTDKTETKAEKPETNKEQ